MSEDWEIFMDQIAKEFESVWKSKKGMSVQKQNFCIFYSRILFS